MFNRWDAEVVLLQTESEIVSAFDIPEEVSRTEVFAERKGANRKEFYAAETIGRKIDEVFELNALDYHGEICLICDEELYDVVRSFPNAHDRVSLSCERRAAR